MRLRGTLYPRHKSSEVKTTPGGTMKQQNETFIRGAPEVYFEKPY
jgi:hypothetical protein